MNRGAAVRDPQAGRRTPTPAEPALAWIEHDGSGRSPTRAAARRQTNGPGSRTCTRTSKADDVVAGWDVGAGWVALRNCPVGGDGPRVGLALLHPHVGVALIGTDPQLTDAATRLRHSLDARRFSAIFSGWPPIVQISSAGLRDGSGAFLAAAFAAQPPLALAGGDAWMATAHAALEAELPVAAPDRCLGAGERRGPSPLRIAVVTAATAVASAVALALSVALFAGSLGSSRTALTATASAEDGLTRSDVIDALWSADAAASAKGTSPAPEPMAAFGEAPARESAGSNAVPSSSPPDASPQPTPANAAVFGRRSSLRTSAPPPFPSPPATAAGMGREERCRAILVRATAGGALSEGDKAFLRRGCR